MYETLFLMVQKQNSRHTWTLTHPCHDQDGSLSRPKAHAPSSFQRSLDANCEKPGSWLDVLFADSDGN